MVHDTSTDHITPEELADYFAAALPESREEEIEFHLGGCDACTEEARQIQAFSDIWDDWIGETHRGGWEPATVAAALQQVQGQVDNPQWAARLRRWHRTWAGRAQAAARLVMEGADRTAQLVTEGLETLIMARRRMGVCPGNGHCADARRADTPLVYPAGTRSGA